MDKKEKVGGRAYSNGVRLKNKHKSVKAYYDSNGDIRIQTNPVRQNKFLKKIKKIPLIRGIAVIIFAILSFLKEVFKYTNNGLILALDNDNTGLYNIKKILGISNDRYTKESKYRKKLDYFFINNNSIKDINELSIAYNIDNMYEYIVENTIGYFEACSKLSIDF